MNVSATQPPAAPELQRRRSPLRLLRRQARQMARGALARLPQPLRFAFYRSLVDCDIPRGQQFQLKIADTRDELEACFALLHDAYVASGFMEKHASGLRVTAYHALPTTTTLCAKVGDAVVGTLSIVREGVFGFPMQSAFDISAVRAAGGRIAEISALAVHPDYQRTGGAILFPLMKFMYEYCTRYFDTRHLVIAVHPNRIELYEALLFFKRLPAAPVEHYDFANGAPAVGAVLDLYAAPTLFERAYAKKAHKRNLHRFFVDMRMDEIRFPARPWHTSNDPVLTPELADHFFNRRTQGFEALEDKRRALLQSIYRSPEWAAVLPQPRGSDDAGIRRHPRFSMKCPGELNPLPGPEPQVQTTIVEVSAHGFQARAAEGLAEGRRYEVIAELGRGLRSRVRAQVVREIGKEQEHEHERLFGFSIDAPDDAWRHCVTWLERA